MALNQVKQRNRVNGLTNAPPRLPVVDLSGLDGPQHDQVVEAVVKAAETFGFIQVVNHGLAVEFLEELKEAVHWFHNQPEEKKDVYLSEVSPSPQVLYAPHAVPEKGLLLDLLVLGYTKEDDAIKHWPDSCKDVALKYLKASTELTKRILQFLMSNLGVTLDESMFDAYMGEKDLLFNYYPTCPDQETVVATRKHTDHSTLTVLLQDHIGGLYGKLNEHGDLDNNYKGEWVEIKPIPGALIILVGDCLQVLSNGKYKGGEHYVQAPPGTNTRVSLPIFMNPKSTTMVRPLPHLVENDGGKPRYKEFLFSDYKNHALTSESPDMRPIHSVQILSH